MAKTRAMKGATFNIILPDNFAIFDHASNPYPASKLREKDVRTNIRDGGLVVTIGIGRLYKIFVKNQSIALSIDIIAVIEKNRRYFLVRLLLEAKEK